MEDLRLVGTSEDGAHLLLAWTDGTGAEFRLPVDGPLRAALREATRPAQPAHPATRGQGQPANAREGTVRPKEIQARIRAGQSPEEVAEAAGVPLARIEAFASPVLRERMHIAELAQRTTVRRPGDSQPGDELGELVGQRLRARGVDSDDLEWDAWRREDNTWKVRLHWTLAGRSSSAEWIYDVSARHVHPVDDEAAALVSSPSTHPTEPNLGEVLERPRLAAVPGGDVVPERSAAPGPAAGHPGGPAGGPAAAPATSGANGATGTTAARAQNAAPTREETAAAGEQRQPLRIARQPAKASRRASVPSWDEIIFGTRRKD